ncbi:MAG: ATP-dependent helicase [Candidatus Nitrosocaldaceae archaeon]
MYLHVLFGSPGTGKTEALSDILVDVELTRGLRLEECLVASFTVDSSLEIVNRVMKKIGIRDEKEISGLMRRLWMGTIHSICFSFCNELGIGVNKVMMPKDFIMWAERNGLEHLWKYGRSNVISQQTILKYGMIEPQDTEAGVILQAIEWVKHTHYEEVLKGRFEDYSRLIYKAPVLVETSISLDYDKLPYYWYDYERYKEEGGKIDYTDMLLIAYAKDFTPPVKVMFIDEFQDLSPLKYAIYRKWKEKMERVYIVGDDDQCIFKFIGSDAKQLLMERDIADRVTILPKTYRLPLTNLSVSMRFIRSNIRSEKREDKWVEPRARGGIFRVVSGVKDICGFIEGNSVGSVFVLVRTNYHLRELTRELFNHPRILIPYEYIRPDAKSIYDIGFVNLVNGILKYEEEMTLSKEEWKSIASRLRRGVLKEGMLKEIIEGKENEYSFDMIQRMLKKPMMIDEIIMNLELSDIEVGLVSRYHIQRKSIELPIKVKIGTIHSAKGLQADTVFLINNITRKISKYIQMSRDNYEDEARVWYVGMTRAKERVYIIDDYYRTGRKFPIE